jgi:hypothetical protein
MSSVEQWQVSLALAAGLVGAALLRPDPLPTPHQGPVEARPFLEPVLPLPTQPPIPPMALPEVAVPPGLPPIGTPPGWLVDPLGGSLPTPLPPVENPAKTPGPIPEPFDCPGCGMG